MGNNFKIEGKTIEVSDGPAFVAGAGCRLEIVDCTITAKVVVDATNAKLAIRGSTITASESFGELSNLNSLEIRDTKMTCPSSGPGLTVLHTEGTIVDSDLRGVPALHARAGANLYIEGGTIEGDPKAIVANNGSVELADVTVGGGIERGYGSTVTTVPRRGATPAPAGH